MKKSIWEKEPDWVYCFLLNMIVATVYMLLFNCQYESYDDNALSLIAEGAYFGPNSVSA